MPDFVLPEPLPNEPMLRVSQSQLAALMQAAPDVNTQPAIASLPRVLTGGMVPPDWQVHRREGVVEFTYPVNKEPITVMAKEQSLYVQERTLYALGIALLDTTDYKRAMWDHTAKTSARAKELNDALYGDGTSPSLDELVEKVKAKKTPRK